MRLRASRSQTRDFTPAKIECHARADQA